MTTAPLFTSAGSFRISVPSAKDPSSSVDTPIYGRFTLWSRINAWIIGFASLIGMAKPSPSTPDSASFMLLMPTTLPSRLTNAPPLFPWLIAASV
ncbi:hypothetical protein D3C75_1188880 [compost metagenome]